MKALCLPLLLAFAVSVVFATDTSSFDGKWKIHSSIVGNESDMVCTFTLKDQDVTGTCTTDNGEVKPTGKVDGAKINFSYNSDYQGTAITVKYAGTLDAATAKISGTVSVDPFNVDGDFSGTQAK